ncbi:rod shape-determining protein MreD [uncultured Tateyamaria sp.]|uniref:rod shape-determining protein MreD n=1 Tax=uncultured Tateyamaria sp. TaxID=455651 RepID=UPI00262DEBB8|nr:rod shape-determining protein MreD [uncultured Tateyamaria sp.]
MNEQVSSRLWTMRLAFGLLVLGIVFLHLLPLQTGAGGLIWPNFVLCFALAWSVRRPEFVPATLLAGMFLLSDLLLQRPPGLWAVLALIACEQMKAQSRALRDASIASEFVSVAIWIVGVGIAYQLILAVLLVEGTPLGPALIQIAVTVLAYPLVVAITHGPLGVRKAAPNELGGRGIG